MNTHTRKGREGQGRSDALGLTAKATWGTLQGSWRRVVTTTGIAWDKSAGLRCPQTSKGRPPPHSNDKGSWLLIRLLGGQDELGQDLDLDPALVLTSEALLCASGQAA